MCTTCGCSNSSNIELTVPGKESKNIGAMEINSADNHHHSHEGHSHDHSHEHGHDHSHSHEGHDHGNSNTNVIQLEKDILWSNNLLAERNRGYFDAKEITAFNIVSSPGSGKTSILERTLTDLKGKVKMSVIEGDQQTTNDAVRISATGAKVVQINTAQACHLDSNMVHEAVKELRPEEKSILFIENVGNLVCPAGFDLGESKRIVVISTTEGDDKPLKYPDMFLSADICIINKIDLLPYVSFSMDNVRNNSLKVNHHLKFIEVSATTGEGMQEWYDFLLK